MKNRTLLAILCAFPFAALAAVACGDSSGVDDGGGASDGGDLQGGGPTGKAEEPDPALVSPSDGNTTGAVGSGGGGGSSAIESLCDGLVDTATRVDVSFHGHPSTAGAQYARARLLHVPSLAPDPTLLRAEDFLAYYGLGYETAVANGLEPLRVRWYQTGGDPLTSTSGVLQADFSASPTEREALRLIVLADVSQSLGSSLPLVHDAIRALGRGIEASTMPGDTMAVLTFAGDIVTELDGPIQPGAPYGGLPIESLALAPREGNDFVTAVREAIKVASNGATSAHVVLLTDGGANVSDDLLEEVRTAASKGIRLSVAQIGAELSTGPAPLARGFLESVAGAGRGGQFYIADTSAADRVFDTRFGPSLAIQARAALLTVKLPPFLRAVGLPMPVPGGASGPAGGALGPDALHPTRIGLQATCPDVFTNPLAGTFDMSAELSGSVAGEEKVLASLSTDWLELRGESAFTARNDAILAVAQALRTRSPADVEAARSELAAVLPDGKFECLECEQMMELKQLLEAAEALP
ncbi:MAG: VWA domain-containing protein [Myxococcales bacterium]|nr:VWA domain-containing protein [Myxococcales bacterium]